MMKYKVEVQMPNTKCNNQPADSYCWVHIDKTPSIEAGTLLPELAWRRQQTHKEHEGKRIKL